MKQEKIRKAIFLDIDGTLTEPGSNDVPPSAVWAVQQARKEGHLVFLCTGRNYDMLKPLLVHEFDGIVASSGGYIACGSKVIYDCPMTETQKLTAMEVLKKNGIFRTVECMDGSYTDEGLKEFLRVHASEGSNSEMLRWREQIEKSLNIRPMSEYRGEPAYKIVIMSQTIGQMLKAKSELSSEFNFCIQEGNKNGYINGEITTKEFDKGRALRRVCEWLDIPLEHTAAFGDSMNDLELLETAALSICMQNGSEELKKRADDICPSVKDDGIKQAFLKYHLAGE